MCVYGIALLVASLTTASIFQTDWALAQSAATGFEFKAIGKIVSVSGSVTIEHTSAVVVQASAGGNGRGKVGDLVYQGDVLQTGADSVVGVIFTDGTAFNLASNARIALSEFVYDPKGKSNSTLFNLYKGTFTFVAGKVAKTGDIKIDTPVATMGIRGTTPRVEIGDDGAVAFSTLVEEPKAKAPERHGGVVAPPNKRQAKDQRPSRTSVARPTEKNLGANLKICRGC